jgi:biotin carboxyl carrier protein
MKLTLRADGKDFPIDLNRDGTDVRLRLGGPTASECAASVVELQPGVFSILNGTRSYMVRVNRQSDGFEIWVDNQRFVVSVADPRDVSAAARGPERRGPQEIRALMPGKVVKVLAELNQDVSVGAGILVVEAMKMQNEMKAPRAGRITKILVREGATVGAGQPLVVLE